MYVIFAYYLLSDFYLPEVMISLREIWSETVIELHGQNTYDFYYKVQECKWEVQTLISALLTF